MDSSDRPQEARVGLVLTGGGARAAYQVGVLRAISEMLPADAPCPFPIICGTSAGAINAASLALSGDGSHHVTLDQVIRTMRDTGADMQAKYKETSRGGLAVNVPDC